MWQGGAMETTRVNIVDPKALKAVLDKLNASDNPTNWVLLGYGEGKNDIVILGSGNGGIEELKTHMDETKVMFAIVELTVTGDDYNPIKRVWITWLGRKVEAGINKARGAGHGTELRDKIKKDFNLSLSSEYQADQLKEVSLEPIAQSITRMRPVYHSAEEVKPDRQAMSGSKSRNEQKSKLIIVQENKVVQALKDIFASKFDWLVLAYVLGKKDEVELIKTGKGGVNTLREEFPAETIYYGILRQPLVTSGRDEVSKFLLITMIGKNVKPLQKARSAGQRQDIADFVMQYCPFHAQYQPSKKDDLTSVEINQVLAKFGN